MANPWVEHVKKYAKDNNISYGCAMSMSEVKASYTPKQKVVKPKVVKPKPTKQEAKPKVVKPKVVKPKVVKDEDLDDDEEIEYPEVIKIKDFPMLSSAQIFNLNQSIGEMKEFIDKVKSSKKINKRDKRNHQSNITLINRILDDIFTLKSKDKLRNFINKKLGV
jgi:hypothetical protein